MPSLPRVLRVLALAFAFGLFAAWAKGTGGSETAAELRTVIGNLSTPWLLVGFVAGSVASRLRLGALLGVLATMAALAGFYLLSGIVQDLGTDSLFADLRQEFSANRGYLEGGLITGPLFGALGAWWRRRQTLRASVVAGALLMAEPLVLIVLGTVVPGFTAPEGIPQAFRLVPGWGLSSESSTISIAVYAGEFILGLCVVLATVRSSRVLRSG